VTPVPWLSQDDNPLEQDIPDNPARLADTKQDQDISDNRA
jgi:hypothetical protein